MTDKMTPEEEPGSLRLGEPHPAAHTAFGYIKGLSASDLLMWEEALASCAISGNRAAEIGLSTLKRILSGQPISDRYLLGLAWMMRFDNGEIKPKEKKARKKK